MRRHRAFRVLPLAFVLCLGGAPVSTVPAWWASKIDLHHYTIDNVPMV